MADPNNHLRTARERTESMQTPGEPLSRLELADLVNAWVYEHTDNKRVVELDANYIGKLERGQIRWPQADYRAGLRAVLGARIDAELGFCRPRRSASTVVSVNRKDFLRAALGVTAGAVASYPIADLLSTVEPTQVPSVVGATEIEQVRTTANVFGGWDATYGGGLVREAVAAQLRYSAKLLNARCPERLRDELHAAVGDLADVAGFMAFDACAHEDARRLFGFALACAEESGNWHLRAKVLSSLARQAIWCGDPENGLTLVELAMVRADRLTATERAMLFSTRARALGKLHRVQDAVTTIGLADECFTHAEPDNDPPWMAYYDAAQHSGDTGHALWDLAVRGRFVSEACARLRDAVAGHTDAYLRSRLFSQTKLASLIMASGDPVEAVMIGNRALIDAGHVRSRRAAENMRELRVLSASHQKITEVAELWHAIGAVVASS